MTGVASGAAGVVIVAGSEVVGVGVTVEGEGEEEVSLWGNLFCFLNIY